MAGLLKILCDVYNQITALVPENEQIDSWGVGKDRCRIWKTRNNVSHGGAS